MLEFAQEIWTIANDQEIINIQGPNELYFIV